MEWYVYYHDFNGQKIVTWNIFRNWVFKESVEKLLKDKKLNRKEFAEKLKTKLMYCFWSKTEYEVIISPWVGKGDEEKIDIYDQVTSTRTSEAEPIPHPLPLRSWQE